MASSERGAIRARLVTNALHPGALLRFSRLHTIVATSVQALGLYVAAGALSGRYAPPGDLLLSWLACLLANVYIVGLNQLTDVAIDRVNKPALPLASGELTPREGRAIVAVAGVVSLALALTQGAALTVTVVLSMLVGTAYSLPPLRLKGRPALAALSIALVRGLVVNAGIYLNFAGPEGRPLPALIVLGALFFFGFGLVIALFKDIPDQAGDGRYGIGTFAVRWGQRPVFNVGRLLLTALYALPLAALAGASGTWRPSLIAAHVALLIIFWAASLRTDPTRQRSMFRLYWLLWGLFYAEYILLALAARAL